MPSMETLSTTTSEPGTVVESANRLQILQVQFTSQLYGDSHTIDWATPDRAAASHLTGSCGLDNAVTADAEPVYLQNAELLF